MISDVMPPGVEHGIKEWEAKKAAEVISDVMPPGVEHAYTYLQAATLARVISDVMPPGVEHRLSVPLTSGPESDLRRDASGR